MSGCGLGDRGTGEWGEVGGKGEGVEAKNIVNNMVTSEANGCGRFCT